jgi:hypothetical protein
LFFPFGQVDRPAAIGRRSSAALPRFGRAKAPLCSNSKTFALSVRRKLAQHAPTRFNRASRMNSASQDFPFHLGVLRERMLHPTAYEKAFSYFLEEFAGDAAFVRASDPEQMPHVISVLAKVVSKAVERAVELEGAFVSYLRAHRFVHGNARAAGRIVLFFYFEEADTGMVMLIPGVHGEAEIARFKLAGGLINPLHN